MEHQHETRTNRGSRWAVSQHFFLTAIGLAAQAPTTEEFAKTVAISDMFEIQSGQLASEKAQNGDVRFGYQRDELFNVLPPRAAVLGRQMQQ